MLRQVKRSVSVKKQTCLAYNVLRQIFSHSLLQRGAPVPTWHQEQNPSPTPECFGLGSHVGSLCLKQQQETKQNIIWLTFVCLPHTVFCTGITGRWWWRWEQRSLWCKTEAPVCEKQPYYIEIMTDLMYWILWCHLLSVAHLPRNSSHPVDFTWSERMTYEALVKVAALPYRDGGKMQIHV